MPRQFEPLKGREFISEPVMNWLSSGSKRSGRPRLLTFLATIINLPRPTKLYQEIAAGYLRNCKLHDREPEFIIKQLLLRDPNFFDGCPVSLDVKNKNALIGRIMKSHLNLGLAQYGKPELRAETKTPKAAAKIRRRKKK